MIARALYFIADEDRTAAKIGVTDRSPKRRLYELQSGSPVILKLEHVEYDIDTALEINLHQHFASHWRHREWFEYAADIKELVDDLKGGNRDALYRIPAAPYPQGFLSPDGFLLSRDNTMRALRAGGGQ